MEKATRKDAKSQAVRESVEEIWLAGLGALALTEEEGTKFFRTLVKKGEGVERRSRSLLDSTMSAAKAAPRNALTKIERRVDGTFENVMHRLGVPTRREITGLTRRIEGLAQSMEKMPRTKRATSLPRSRKTAAPANETNVS